MNLFTALAVYFIIWILVFLAALPFGVRSQWEDGDIAHGSEPGAPVAPMLLKKAMWTTLIAAGFWLALFLFLQYSGVTVDDLPGPDRYWE